MPQAGGSKTRGNGGGKNVAKQSGKLSTPFNYPMTKKTGDGAKKPSHSKSMSSKRSY